MIDWKALITFVLGKDDRDVRSAGLEGARAWIEGDIDVTARIARRRAVVRLELKRLHAAGVSLGLQPLVVLKGEAVADLYPSPSMRGDSADVDLLGERDEQLQWVQVAESLGYASKSEWTKRTESNLHSIALRAEIAGFPLALDLHRHLSEDRTLQKFGYADLIQHARPSASGLLVPSLADCLLISAIHFTTHHQPTELKTIWLLDAIAIVDSFAGEKQDLIAVARTRAQQFDLGWALESYFNSVESFLETPIFGAVATTESKFARARSRGAGIRFDVAEAKELGFTRGSKFLLLKFDPRRYATNEPDGGWHGFARFLRRNFERNVSRPLSRFIRSRPKR